MPKKWKTNRPFQNWKKAVAVFLWHWIVLFAVAQTFPNLPEISVSDGLPTASTRRIIEINSGTVLIATDAGLYYAPKEQPSLEKIKTQVGTQQCWDLHLNQNTLTIATYNDGLYVFDISTGNLIQHFKKEQLHKIRRLREINGKLYCIARQGIYEIKGNKAILKFSASQLPENNMPMDLFFWQAKMHVLSYPKRVILQQQNNGSWLSLQDILKQKNLNYPLQYFCNLTAFSSNNFIYLGGVNAYTQLDTHGNMKQFTLKSHFYESWAFWDFQIHKNIMYAAVSNTADFNDGYLHVHDPQTLQYDPPHQQSIWSITPSKFKDALWISSETNGAHLLVQPNTNPFKPTDFVTQVKATSHFIVRHNLSYLSIQNNPRPGSAKFLNEFKSPDRIREIAEINGELYLMGSEELWKFNPKKGSLDSLFNCSQYQWMFEKNGLLWFFEPYGSVYTFHPNHSLPTKTNIIAKADCVRKYNNNIYYHIMGEGFAMIDEHGRAFKLNSQSPIIPFTLNFEVIQNKLILQNANQYDVYLIDQKNHTIRYQNKMNFTEAFRDFQIIQTFSDGKFLYLYTGKYLVKLNMANPKKSIEIVQQLYLGQWRNQGPVIQLDNQFVIDRGNTVQSVMFEPFSNPNFNVQYSYTNEPGNFFRPYFSVNTEKNFKITVNGNHYFNNLRSLYSVELTDMFSKEKQVGFFRGDAYYWINGIGKGKFNLAVSLGNTWRSHFIIGTTEYYRDFPFWLMLLSLLTLLYWVFYNQTKNQESLQKRIATLRLQTLQSNFNPHFIFNSMSLIQSLIVGAETKKAVDVTARLAKLNRLFLSNSKKELIYLKDELDFIKEYVAMEKMRFESDTNFPFQIKVSSKVKITEWLIPPLILQPLVENAIKHGVLASKQISEITIAIELFTPNSIQINIINSGAVPSRKRSTGMGMGNQLVSDRISVFNELYPNQFHATFTFGPNANKEYVANIRIEKLKNEKKSKFSHYINGGGGKSL